MKRPGTPNKGTQIEALFLNHPIICHICNGRIYWSDEKDWDHRVEHKESQDNTAANLTPVHRDCHRIKSAKKNSERRHIDRLEKEKNGFPKRKRLKQKIQSRPFPKVKA